MNTSYYKNFIETVESETLSAASRKIHISQPALSNQIKLMEEEFGTPLFRRSVYGMELTEAGKIVYERAKTICRLEDDAKQQVMDEQLGAAGTLAISIAPSAPDRQIKKLFLEFSEENPAVQFEFYESASYSAIDALCNGLSEIAVIRKSSNLSPRLCVWYSIEEPLVVLFHNDTHWFDPAASKLSVQDLDGVPLSIPRGLYASLREACLAGGFYPKFLNICSYRDSSLLWAQHGRAAAVISAPSARDCSFSEMTCLPLETSIRPKHRLIATLKDRPLSPTAEKFLSFCGDRLDGWTRCVP